MTSAPIAHSSETERAVLGAVLMDPRVFPFLDLEGSEFFDPKHHFVWDAMQSLHAAEKPIDPASVGDELGERLPAVGGFSYILDVAAAACAPSSATHHAERIRQLAMTRRIRCELAELKEADLDADELLARIQAIGSKAASSKRSRGRNIGEWVNVAFKAVQGDIDRGTKPGWFGRGLSTGLGPLDEVLGGIKLGVLTVLAGRPSQGKSALARNIADHLSSQGVGVHVFSMEDSGEAYARRALADIGKVNLARFAVPRDLNAGELRRIREGAAKLWDRKHWLIDDVSGLSSRDIGIQVRLQREQNQTQLVIVDYVGHMHEPAAKQGDETSRITQATKGLFHLARTEGVAVMMLSQLNRAAAAGERHPILSDLRQSGEIEQDAECVMFTHRQSEYCDDEKEKAKIAHEAEVVVRKNKNGLTGIAKLGWDGASTSFRNPGTRHLEVVREGWGE